MAQIVTGATCFVKSVRVEECSEPQPLVCHRASRRLATMRLDRAAVMTP